MLIDQTEDTKQKQRPPARITFRWSWRVSWLVVPLLAFIWLGWHATAFYYQAEGGRRLAMVQTAVPNDRPLYSSASSSAAPGSMDQVTQAIADLQTSLKYNPDDSQTFLLLGRAYLLTGQSDQAVEAYRTYIRLRPANPLGHLELGFAYEAQCRSRGGSSGSYFDCPNAIAEWRAGGLDSSQFIGLGDDAFKQRHWADAFAWYTRVGDLGTRTGGDQPLPFDLLFREMFAAALAQSADAQPLLNAVRTRDSTFRVYSLQDNLTIQGTGFRWMTPLGDGKDANYGIPLSNGGSGTAGFLWWNGQAMALLSVAQAGNFSLRARLQDGAPPPVEMAIGVDGQQLEQITLSRGDDSWETLTLPVSLAEGFHSIDVWYLNDAIIDGRDRNAGVEWVTIERN